MSQYFPEQYGRSGARIKGELDLFSYAMEADLKETTSIDRTMLVPKTDLVSF